MLRQVWLVHIALPVLGLGEEKQVTYGGQNEESGMVNGEQGGKNKKEEREKSIRR